MCVQAQSIETKIIHNIQDEIITNVDIKNEFKYLVALNNSLKELDEEKILNISNESIITPRPGIEGEEPRKGKLLQPQIPCIALFFTTISPGRWFPPELTTRPPRGTSMRAVNVCMRTPLFL